MTKRISALIIATLLALGLHAAPAQAQLTRTFVSANGSDANDCSRGAACRTFAGALAKTNAGGEINVLDPAGYGTVNINKSISIVNDGVGSAGVLVPSGGTGISINAGANGVVNLRGLIIEGAGVGQNGIEFTGGKSLNIENCVIRNLTELGIFFLPDGSHTLTVSNTLISDNGGTAIYLVPTGSGTVTAVIDRVEIDNNAGSGVSLSGSLSTGVLDATVVDSAANGNANGGFTVFSATGNAAATLTVVRSIAANNQTGLSAFGANATVRVEQSTVTGNTTGWSITSSGVLLSYGDNYIDGNIGGETAPPGTSRK
jgi:Right handed beta helix region